MVLISMVHLQLYKINFVCNIFDDIEYLMMQNFYHRNKDNLFEVDNIDIDRFLESDTRKYRKNF